MAKKLELMEKPKGGNKNTSKFYLEIDAVNGVPYLCWEVFSINNKNHIFVMGFGFPLIPGGCYKPTVPSPASPGSNGERWRPLLEAHFYCEA